jgi:hypothetical protein
MFRMWFWRSWDVEASTAPIAISASIARSSIR